MVPHCGIALPTWTIWRVACGHRKHFVGIGFVFLPVPLQFHQFRLPSPAPDSSMLLSISRGQGLLFSLRQGHWTGSSRSSSFFVFSFHFRIAYIYAALVISRIIMVIARCGKACWDLSIQAVRAARANFVTFLSVCSLIKILNPRSCGSFLMSSSLDSFCRATTTFSVICRIPSFNSNWPGTQAVCSKAERFDRSAWCGALELRGVLHGPLYAYRDTLN